MNQSIIISVSILIASQARKHGHSGYGGTAGMASSCVKPKRLCLVALAAVLWVWAAPGSGFVQGGRGAPKRILGVGA